jgi:hypothetical protein
LNEANRDEVIADFFGWLPHISPLSRPADWGPAEPSIPQASIAGTTLKDRH